MITTVVAIALGYVIGLMQKGIKITIANKEKEVQTEYNKSTADMLPDEVKKYLEATNGMINV